MKRSVGLLSLTITLFQSKSRDSMLLIGALKLMEVCVIDISNVTVNVLQ